MKFVIANILVAFCFIGYVEAQAISTPGRAEEENASERVVRRRTPPTPTAPNRSNPNNSSVQSLNTRKREDEIDLKDVPFDVPFAKEHFLPENPTIKKETKKQKQASPKAIAPKQNYRYSFSGADCNVFARVRNTSRIIHLDSVSTVSVSIYEAKAPVRRLGHASPVGFTGNIRTVAGSIICVLRDNHPLSEMMEGNFHTKHLDDNQIRDNGKGNFNSGALYPFDLMLMYKNEVGDALGFSIYNVEIISEGIVTSTNDMITEVVLQFQATHIDQIEKVKPIKEPEPKPIKVVPPVETLKPKSENLKVFYEFILYGNLTIYNENYDFTTSTSSSNEITIDGHGNTTTFNNLISEVQVNFGFHPYNLGSQFSTVNNNGTILNKKNFVNLREDGSVRDQLIESIFENGLLPLNKDQVVSLISSYSITIDLNKTDQTDNIDLQKLLLTGVTKNIEYEYQDLESPEAQNNDNYEEELAAIISATITKVELKLELTEG